MSPAELLDLRRNNEEMWRRLIRENTVIAIASASPTDKDRKTAEETIRRVTSGASTKQRARVRFNDQMEAIFAPVGRAYAANEQTTRKADQLELEKAEK